MLASLGSKQNRLCSAILNHEVMKRALLHCDQQRQTDTCAPDRFQPSNISPLISPIDTPKTSAIMHASAKLG